MGKILTATMIMLAMVMLAGCGPELAPTTGSVDAISEQAQPATETPTLIPSSPADAPPPPALVDHPTVTPIPTTPPAIPPVDITPVSLQEGHSLSLVTVPQAEWFSTPGAAGELCDLHVSPDAKWTAVSMCATELILENVYVVANAGNEVILANMTDSPTGASKPLGKPTWFRGWFPDSRRILLMSDRLEVFNIETGESRRLTAGNETVTDAAISPDGQTIAYTTIQGDQIRMVDLDGNPIRTVRAPASKPGDRPEGIAWSPDGSGVAFVWDQTVIQFNSYGPLWMADMNTEQMSPLSPDGVFDGYPVWSPVGNHILVVRRENMDDNDAHFDLTKLISNLWMLDLKAREWHQLTELDGKGAWDPKWTSDGSAVVFMSNLSDNPEVWLINADGTGLQQLTSDNQMMPRAFDVLP